MDGPGNDRDRAKQAAAKLAVETFVRDGMKLGLGSGTTSHLVVRALGERVREEMSVIGIPTSTQTRDLAIEQGIALADLNQFDQLDLTLDGADQIDPRGDMIKGGGACLLWEKIVARASKRVVAVVDDSKRIDVFGGFPLPVEVIPFGWMQTRKHMARLFAVHGHGGPAIELRGGADNPLVTDSGNYLLDCHLKRIEDARDLALRLSDIPGVVEHGLFIGVATDMVVGHPDGTANVVPIRGD